MFGKLVGFVSVEKTAGFIFFYQIENEHVAN